jgi:hypothetical protein
MNVAEAKEILVVYRPGTADSSDPAFAEALRLCEQDPELKRWFDEHCAVYVAVRDRFREIPVPEGLKQQILAERKVQSMTFSRRKVVLGVVVAVAVLTGLLSLLSQRPEDTKLSGFRTYMTQTTLGYYMDFETNDLTLIRGFLAKKKADTGYVIPGALEKQAKATGCCSITWQGKPVSLICFHSGRPLAPGDKNDLWLFVTSDTSITGTPAKSVPTFRKVNQRATASWSQNGRTYLLVADGDEEFLRKYL